MSRSRRSFCRWRDIAASIRCVGLGCRGLFVLGAAGTLGCATQSSSAPSNHPAEEITIGEEAAPEPEPPLAAPALPELVPCKKGDANGCGTERSDEDKRVVSGQHYTVPVLPSDPTWGPADAPVTIVVFSDFQCPYCGALEPTLAALKQHYPGRLRVVWKDNPLSIHPFARPAALLAREAMSRGGSALFWRVHDRIFERQAELDSETLRQIAEQFQLSWPPSEMHEHAIEETSLQARDLGVRSTPTSFVNGWAIVGNQPFDRFREPIDRELAAHGAPDPSAR